MAATTAQGSNEQPTNLSRIVRERSVRVDGWGDIGHRRSEELVEIQGESEIFQLVQEMTEIAKLCEGDALNSKQYYYISLLKLQKVQIKCKYTLLSRTRSPNRCRYSSVSSSVRSVYRRRMRAKSCSLIVDIPRENSLNSNSRTSSCRCSINLHINNIKTRDVTFTLLRQVL